MKTLMFLFGVVISFHANAEIFKCKDSTNKISYQSNPCSTTTLGKVRKDAGISEEDRLKAQERIDGVFERERQRNAAEERERAYRQDKAKKFQLEKEAKINEDKKIKLLERQAIAAEEGAIAAKEAAASANQARIAAEQTRSQQARNQQLKCRSDYAGGLICN